MKKIKRLPLFAALAVLALPASAAFASGDAGVTGTVNPGSLTISTSATPTFSVTLDGTNKTGTYTIPASLVDATGTDAGWNLTATSTQFTDGDPTTPHTLATTASTITSVDNACNASSTCTTVTNSTTPNSFPTTIPAGATAPTAVEFFSADLGTGAGKWDTTPHVSVAIPATTFAAAYTSTVTLAAVSGP